MAMAEPPATGSPLLPARTSTLQNPNPDAPSPMVPDVQLPASTSPAPSLPQIQEQTQEQAQEQATLPVNGVALAAAATAVIAAAAQSGVVSPDPRPDTPQSQPHPPTTGVNGQVAPPPPAPTTPGPGPGVSLSASTSSNPTPGGAGARSKEQLRWRDPITVNYDSGQAQPGKLQPSNPSPQLKQLQPQPQHMQPQSQFVQQSQPQPQQHPTPPPQHAQSQPLPQPFLHAQQQQQQQPSHQQHMHSHSQQPQQQAQEHQPQYIQQHQNQHSHQHPYPLQQHPHVHPQHKQPLHPPPPPPQVAPPVLPPLHHQHPSQLPLPHSPAGRPPATQSTISRPVIMDPPGSRKASASPHPKGFPSPNLDHARVNSKFIDDCTRMTYAVQQSLPEAVRRTVRDHWEKCLFGSEFHQAFILNASIHHSQPSITRRAVRDFGEKMVRESKSELVSHFRAADFDEVADLIINKVSDSFLDKCLAKRLRTIEAKPLINALAKAERLGYEPGDIVEGDHHEHVIPQEAYPGATATAGTNGFAPSRSAQQPPQPQPQPYPTHHQLQCLNCFRTFTQLSAHEYHTRYNVCHQAPPTSKGFEHSCSYCGQGFTRVEELQVHLADRVCTTPATKTSRGPGRPARSAPLTQTNPVAILPSMNPSPGPNGYSSSYDQTQSTPTHHSTGPRPSIGTPNSVSSPNASDPYAHLSQDTLNRMNQELQDAEIKYAPRFAEAEAIPDENERRAKIEGLRNSFGTKQSMIRKKYGVRLRERRTKAEIAAERERLGLKRAEREKAKAILAKQQLAANASAQAAAAAAGGSGSGWTAANTPRSAQDIGDDHDAKRRRLDGPGGGYQSPYKLAAEETPTRKTLSVSELGGGLSGTSATAETQDPTRPPQSAQPPSEHQRQAGAVEMVTLDSQPQSPDNVHSQADTAASNSDNASRRTSLQGSSTSPLPGHTTQSAADDMDVDSGSSDDDQDIPSTLPASVRSSLVTQSHSQHA